MVEEPEARATADTTAPQSGSVGLLGGLEVGLAGPPVLGADGGFWLLGRDGEVERFESDESLSWSISIHASITGESAVDESGRLVFIPTASDHVVALDKQARVHWKYRAPAGVVGSVCWVPKQGLVFSGRDRQLYWLDERASLVLRSPLRSRVSAGPTPFGARVLVGTEEGRVFVLSRDGKRQSVPLEGPIAGIAAVDGGTGAYVLANHTVYFLDGELSVQWTRTSFLAIGVTASREHGSKQEFVTLSESGDLEWHRRDGNVKVAANPALDVSDVPKLAAIQSAAWVSDASGTLWEARPSTGWLALHLGHSPLLRPIVDARRGRVLVGSVQGSVWSVSAGQSPQ